VIEYKIAGDETASAPTTAPLPGAAGVTDSRFTDGADGEIEKTGVTAAEGDG